MKILVCVVVCATAVWAQHHADSEIQTKIIAMEKAWNQAYKLGDRRALDTLLDDEIVLINDDGSVQSKAEFLSSITPANSQEQQVAPESISVHVFGDTATATGVFRAKGTEHGKHYDRRERFVDTWINKGGHWVCVASNATPVLH